MRAAKNQDSQNTEKMSMQKIGSRPATFTQNYDGNSTSEKPFTGTTDFVMFNPRHMEKSADT